MKHVSQEQNKAQPCTSDDARLPHVFDQLRAQETPEAKEAFLALSAYQGNDEVLLCRKAQVLMNLKKVTQAQGMLEPLKHPLAVATRLLLNTFLKKIDTVTDHGLNGEAYVWYLRASNYQAHVQERYNDALIFAEQGVAASRALHMTYQANLFKSNANEALRELGLELKYQTKETGNLLQAQHNYHAEFRNHLRQGKYIEIQKAPYPVGLKRLAIATKARQESRYGEALSFTARTHLMGEWKAYLCFLHLELFLRTKDDGFYTQPKEALQWLKENLHTLDHPEIARNCARLYPLGFYFTKKHIGLNADVYILSKTRIYSGSELRTKGVPRKTQVLLNSGQAVMLTCAAKTRLKQALKDIKVHELITSQQAEICEKLNI